MKSRSRYYDELTTHTRTDVVGYENFGQCIALSSRFIYNCLACITTLLHNHSRTLVLCCVKRCSCLHYAWWTIVGWLFICCDMSLGQLCRVPPQAPKAFLPSAQLRERALSREFLALTTRQRRSPTRFEATATTKEGLCSETMTATSMMMMMTTTVSERQQPVRARPGVSTTTMIVLQWIVPIPQARLFPPRFPV